MKKLVVGVLYAFCMLTAVHSGDISAQTGTGTAVDTTTTQGTTPNLITSGSTHTWYGVTTGAIPAGCATAGPCPGGPQPIYDPSTNTVNFSYNANATVAQTIAINNALSSVGAGVKINGYNYSYDVRNMNGDNRQGGIDTLVVNQALVGTNGTNLLSSSQTYNTKFEWQTISGTKTATTPIEQAAASYLKFSMTGGDNGYWGGYFGPQVRNVNMSLSYGAAPIVQHTMGDDGWVNVPLQFGFPFYGKVFTNSFMFDNGVVGFFDPIAGGCNPANGYCGGQQWNSQPFSNNMGNQFSYMIAPAWADLAPNSQTRYLTQGDSTFQKYTWENISQYYDQSKLQTFDLTIKPSGFIGVNYGNINLNQTNLGIGTIGNPSLGEYTQIGFYNAGTNITGVPNWSMNQTQAVDLCTTDPLSSPSCPNYATAYLSQQCSISALYSPSCPGYASAYFSQQCSANPLYNTSCPGYASAYLDYQCSVDPLYSTTCQGYTQAYHDQQCSINPLYATDCVGYSTAYFNQQCTADPLYSTQCSGYAAAYKTQQCTANPLYATDCLGYAVAYKAQQCTASALYATDCPRYAEAYFSQQCTANGLYNNQCPNYSEAYAKKMLLEQQGMASTVATAGTVAQVAQVAAVASADPANATATATSSAISSDSNVAAAVTVKTPTAASTDTQPAAAVKLTPPPPPPAMQMAQAEPKKNDGPGEKKEEKKEEGAKKNDNGPTSAGPSGDSKPSDQPKSNREALQERRREAAQKEAVAKGGNLANEMGKAADMEAQKAVQNVVIAAMGFTPGFDTYNKAMLPDANRFYKPYQVYGNQKVIDNRFLSRGLTGGSDKTHQEMVDSQYNRGN